MPFERTPLWMSTLATKNDEYEPQRGALRAAYFRFRQVAEAFVLGGAFLLHDLGMGLASFAGGADEVKADPLYQDSLRIASRRMGNKEPADLEPPVREAVESEALVEVLRARHAKQAERLI